MTKHKKRILLAALSVVLILVLMEIGTACAYWLKENELFYLRDRPASSNKALHDKHRAQQILHPFWGFTLRTGLGMSELASPARLERLLAGSSTRPDWVDISANNLGFFSTHDYPYQRRGPEEYIIGVFGGSVAQWFALQGSEVLQECLAQAPQFTGRKITVLNFGQGGYKQPQQLMVLAHLLSLGQELDFVLNIDGFNEIALSAVNSSWSIDASMPSIQHIGPLVSALGSDMLDLRRLRAVYDLARLSRKRKRLLIRRSRTRSAALHLVLTAMCKRTQVAYAKIAPASETIRDSQEEARAYHLLETQGLNDLTDCYERALLIWENSSLTMQQILERRGIPYLEIVQPNQYYMGKIMSPAERSVAISTRSPYRRAVEEGYPLAEKWAAQARLRGLNIVKALHIFDAVRAPLFSDDACHYNQTGNEVLARFLADQMLLQLRAEDDGPEAEQTSGHAR